MMEPSNFSLVEDFPRGTFRWTIINFSQMEGGKLHYSDVFFIGNSKWQLVLLGRPETSDLSLFLRNAEKLEDKWYRFARFSLRIVSQRYESLSHQKDTAFRFSNKTQCWGFKSFILFQTLVFADRDLLVRDTLIIEAFVEVRRSSSLPERRILSYQEGKSPKDSEASELETQNSEDFSVEAENENLEQLHEEVKKHSQEVLECNKKLQKLKNDLLAAQRKAQYAKIKLAKATEVLTVDKEASEKDGNES